MQTIAEDSTPDEILNSARDEALRALVHNTVSCLTYDTIADLAITANLLINPELKKKMRMEPEDGFIHPNIPIKGEYSQLCAHIKFEDPTTDLWSIETANKIRECIEHLVAANDVVNHSLRGSIVCTPMSSFFDSEEPWHLRDVTSYTLIISAIIREDTP